jgi:hypothetical protein
MARASDYDDIYICECPNHDGHTLGIDDEEYAEAEAVSFEHGRVRSSVVALDCPHLTSNTKIIRKFENCLVVAR